MAGALGGGFADPKVGRGAAFGDFDRDGDLDVLITTNQGPVHLYRNDQSNGHHAIRFRLVGTKSNRDAIGATVRVTSGGETGSRMVKSGSSYLSQSEMPVTFGLGRRDTVERAVVHWPGGASGGIQEPARWTHVRMRRGQGYPGYWRVLTVPIFLRGLAAARHLPLAFRENRRLLCEAQRQTGKTRSGPGLRLEGKPGYL